MGAKLGPSPRPHPRTKGTVGVRRHWTLLAPYERAEQQPRPWADPASRRLQAFLEPRPLCSGPALVPCFRGPRKARIGKKGREPWEAVRAGRGTPFPLPPPVDSHSGPPAALRLEFVLRPVPSARIRRLQGERRTWRWQGWCGAAPPKSCLQEAAPADPCFPSVLAPVSPRCGHAVLP